MSHVLLSGMIVTSALIIWKALMCITGSESPVVVVLSESMEPGFKRGDILFLHMNRDPIRAGEIVVFNVDVCFLFYRLASLYFYIKWDTTLLTCMYSFFLISRDVRFQLFIV